VLTAYPFERFTERAKRALVLAQQEAEGFHHSYIGTEHVLLGLLRERDGLAAKVLDNFGVDMRKVRDAIHSMPGHDERADTQSITPTPRAKKVIEISFEESRRMDHSYVGTEHLLLGLLIEGEGTAAPYWGIWESPLRRHAERSTDCWYLRDQRSTGSAIAY